MGIAPIDRQVVVDRLIIIEESIVKLSAFQSLTLEKFKEGENFAIAEHYLRRALEAMLEVGNHILSRLPGEKPKAYKDIPRLLGKAKIIPQEFAEKELSQMAGYRNRLIHFYHQITVEEMYNLIQHDIQDLARFVEYLKQVLKRPEDFNLSLD